MSTRAPYIESSEDDVEGKNTSVGGQLAALWRLTGLLRPHRARFALTVVTVLLASASTLIYPQAARYAIDVGMTARDTDKLDLIITGLIALFVVNAGLVWLRYYTTGWLGERVVADLRALVFDRLLTLPLSWFHDRRSGEMVGRIGSDVTLLEGVVGDDLPMAFRNVVQIIGGMVALLLVDARLTLVLLATALVIVLASTWFGGKIRVKSRLVQDELARVSGHVQETIAAISTVQSFVRESYESSRYRTGIEGVFERALAMVRWRAWFFASTMAAASAVIVAVIWLGGRAVIQGDLSAGDLASFFLYTFMMAGGLSDLANNWGSLQRAAGATDRLASVINTVPDIRDPERPRALPDGKGAIRFEGVSFAYPSRPEHPVLVNLDLDARPGEVIAVVGPSGAGKSTILSLMVRFYDVTAGRVLFEGVDVRDLELKSLRRSIAMVAQEPVLFSGTIRDNIRYGREGATDDEIEQAARDANAHDFISAFPHGYDTIIGERGTTLSGGQRQRIALARTLIAKPRVLVLDEATSNLDAESEAAVQAALARIREGRTTIIVAHRLSTVRDAARVIVIDGARIVEQGHHEELMKRRGTYHQLVQRQLLIDRNVRNEEHAERS